MGLEPQNEVSMALAWGDWDLPTSIYTADTINLSFSEKIKFSLKNYFWFVSINFREFQKILKMEINIFLHL